MRRPSAVVLRAAERRDPLAALDALADRELRERRRIEVAVQRVERVAVVGRVAQDDHAAVVEPAGVLVGRVDLAGERRVDRRAGLGEQIEAEVDRAVLVERAVARGEQRRGVQQARLVVAADRDPHAGRAHRVEHPPGERGLGVALLVAADNRAGDAEIEHERRLDPEVDAEHRRERRGPRGEPALHRRARRNRREAAGAARGRRRDPERDPREPGQRAGQRRLADPEVRVAGMAALLVRGEAGAHAQPQRGEAEHRRHLRLGERAAGAVAVHEVPQHRQRSRRVEHGVRGGDRELADGDAVHHVAEVDDAGDALVAIEPIVAAAHQHVVVVEVAVDRAARQLAEQRRGVPIELADQRVDRGAELAIGDARAMAVDRGAAVREVPVEVAVQRGVVEAVERSGQLGDRRAEPLEQRGTAARRAGERHARQVRHQPRQVDAAIRRGHRGQRGAARQRLDARGQRRAPRHVLHRALLGGQERPVLAGAGDLQHQARLVVDRQQEVLVALAGQRGGRRGVAEQLARQRLGAHPIEARRVVDHERAAYHRPAPPCPARSPSLSCDVPGRTATRRLTRCDLRISSARLPAPAVGRGGSGPVSPGA